jgi:hypothetical protein
MLWSAELYSIYEVKKNSNEKLFQSYLKRFSAKAIDIFQNKINQCILTNMPLKLKRLGTFLTIE